MMKKENKTAIIFIIAAITAITALYLISSQNTNKSQTETKNYVAGYSAGSAIKITAVEKEKINTEIITVNNSNKTSFPDKTINTGVIFNINDGENIYDITAVKSDKNLIFTFENLPLESKVSLISDRQVIHQDVPVDWVGNLVLKATKTSGQFCSQIDQQQEICFYKNREDQT